MSVPVPQATAAPATADPGGSPIVASSAAGLDVDLAYRRTSTDLGSVALVSGSAPPPYDAAKFVSRLDRTFNFDWGQLSSATLELHATDIHTNATSRGVAVDSVSSHASADIGSSEFLLTSNPLHPQVLGILGFSFSASSIHSSADFSHVFGSSRNYVAGDASFGSLSIGGALIGKTLKFSGHAEPNTVLFESPTVTITLDKQTVTDVIGGGSGNGVTPVHITTDAVDISLHNATLFGTTVSGDIVIGGSSAGGSNVLGHPGGS